MSRRARRRAAWVAVLVALLGLSAIGALWWLSRPPSEASGTVIIDVEPGTTVRTLGRRLAAEGVIRSPLLFEAWLRIGGDARRIQAGTYALPLDRTLPAIAGILVEGRTLLASVTVPEGLRLEETAGRAARALGIDSAAFAAAASDPALADSLGIEAGTLEGYLFPETYRVAPDIGPRDLARVMVAHFRRVFTPAWQARADSLGRSIHEIVTLASIVEEEARIAAERPVIAGVFWNRLEAGMLLEADPTVQYALGGHRERVLYEDLEVDSPYNTYRNTGLPPGPIASPGRASLEATLYPDSVPYYYFVATGEDGRHAFSETFAEHLQKIRALR
ncbi:MAG TPA: endolytic transglycosylase MltG [Gemmatimonadota bacterium]|nr:endolytic transglycosylase MltG [Gemmatimonadota bacterium]